MSFKSLLPAKIVGQDEGVQALVDLYQVFCAGLNSRDVRWVTCCCWDPLGLAEARIVEAAAEILLRIPARSSRSIAPNSSTRTKSPS